MKQEAHGPGRSACHFPERTELPACNIKNRKCTWITSKIASDKINTLNCQKYPTCIYTEYVLPKAIVSLWDQPFSRCKVVENPKCTEWPQTDLEHLTVKSTLHILKTYFLGQMSSRLALRWFHFETIAVLGVFTILQWWTWNFREKILKKKWKLKTSNLPNFE